jgi:hypothetical protein
MGIGEGGRECLGHVTRCLAHEAPILAAISRLLFKTTSTDNILYSLSVNWFSIERASSSLAKLIEIIPRKQVARWIEYNVVVIVGGRKGNARFTSAGEMGITESKSCEIRGRRL